MPCRLRQCFSDEEDDQLRDLVRQFGSNSWLKISSAMPGRTARQCRDRWSHYLSRSAPETPWTADEDTILLEKITIFGLKWTQLATFFSNRTDLDIKKRWFWICQKRHDVLIKDAVQPIRSTRQRLKSVESSDDKGEKMFPEMEIFGISNPMRKREKQDQDSHCREWPSLKDTFGGDWMNFG
jgi:hypothetical protein